MAVSCPVCGAENPDSAEFCNLCLAEIGFECSEYATPVSDEGGLLERYPSSFDPGAPCPDQSDAFGDPAPGAPRVDIGEYGVTSGHQLMDSAPMFYPGETPVPPPGVPGAPGSAGRVFDWGHAMWVCAGVAAPAAAISIGLELVFSFIGFGFVYSGNLSAGMAVILLALIIPVMLAGFAPGYRLQRYGWAVGLISVSMWAFILRPLYYAFLSWLLADSFQFTALFNRYSLVFIFGLFLPLGAFMGWIGEKRATTGLYF